jgi:hypothetical protein
MALPEKSPDVYTIDFLLWRNLLTHVCLLPIVEPEDMVT